MFSMLDAALAALHAWSPKVPLTLLARADEVIE
jgi:hypothetical protein